MTLGHWAMYVPEGCITEPVLNYNGVADTHKCINDTNSVVMNTARFMDSVDLGVKGTIDLIENWKLNIAATCSLGWRYAQVLVS
jgi:hypothetical protein